MIFKVHLIESKVKPISQNYEKTDVITETTNMDRSWNVPLGRACMGLTGLMGLLGQHAHHKLQYENTGNKLSYADVFFNSPLAASPLCSMCPIRCMRPNSPLVYSRTQYLRLRRKTY